MERLHQITRLILLDIRNEIGPRTFCRVIREDHFFIHLGDLLIVIFKPPVSRKVVDVDPVVPVGNVAPVNEDRVQTVAMLATICELLFKSRFQVIRIFVQFYYQICPWGEILSTCFRRLVSYRERPSSSSVGTCSCIPEDEKFSKNPRAIDNNSKGFNGKSLFSLSACIYKDE